MNVLFSKGSSPLGRLCAASGALWAVLGKSSGFCKALASSGSGGLLGRLYAPRLWNALGGFGRLSDAILLLFIKFFQKSTEIVTLAVVL